MPDKIVATRTYVVVCATLLGLTGVTIGLAQLDLRGWNSVLALTIAAAKAVLIGVFFAALKQTSPGSGLLPLVAARLAALVTLGAVALWRRLPWRIGRDVIWLIVVCGAFDIFAPSFQPAK